MKYETLVVEKSEGIATVTLNRPAKLNALSRQMRMELLDLALKMREDLDTRFVIFTGAGRAFSAGADVQEMRETPGETVPAPIRARLGQHLGHDMARALENMEQITIAAVNGLALGAGMGVCMACDFRVMSQKAYFGIPEAMVGVFYTWGCTSRLAHLVGPAWAKDLIMTCRNVDAQEALRIGLAQRVVPPEKLMAEARALAKHIGRMPPLVIRLTKKLVNASAAPQIGDIFLTEPELVERINVSPDRLEAVNAFLEKREAKYTGL